MVIAGHVVRHPEPKICSVVAEAVTLCREAKKIVACPTMVLKRLSINALNANNKTVVKSNSHSIHHCRHTSASSANS